MMGIKHGLRKIAAGKWQVVARVRVAGKIRSKKQTVTGTKEDAKPLLEQFKNELRGTTPTCSLTFKPRTFGDIIRKYRELNAEPFSRTHEYNVKRMENELGPVECPALPARLEKAVLDLRKVGKNHQANRFIEVARAAYKVCKGIGALKINPITPELFPESKEEPHDISLPIEERARIVLIAARNRRVCHIARYLQYVFQVPSRKQEIIGVEIRDVDLFNMAIRIHNGVTKNKEGLYKPIPPSMHKWVRRRKREAASLEEPLFGRFVKCRGAMVPIGDFKNAWKTVKTAAGYPNLTVHDSRHISATEMRDNGTPDHIINELAGWKTNMLDTYYHRSPKRNLKLVKFSRREPDVNPKQAEAV